MRLAVIAGWVLASACAPGAQSMKGAGRTIASSWQVVAEAERTLEASADPDGETEVRAALRAASTRLREAEDVVRIWQQTGVGRAGWYAISPCLGASLTSLRLALERAGLDVPRELDQAEVMAEDLPTERCAEQRQLSARARVRPPSADVSPGPREELADRLGSPAPTPPSAR